MPRTNLDLGLQELQRQMRKLDEHVNDMLAKTLKVLETGDHLSLPRVIESTIPLHVFSTATEQQALRLLILQQPLGEQDLRLLMAVLQSARLSAKLGMRVANSRKRWNGLLRSINRRGSQRRIQ